MTNKQRTMEALAKFGSCTTHELSQMTKFPFGVFGRETKKLREAGLIEHDGTKVHMSVDGRPRRSQAWKITEAGRIWLRTHQQAEAA